ncbi:MAG: hypothetical protein U1F76_00405 [Candidatus Competibacteraceae bacterium]
MTAATIASQVLAQEAHALLTRLERVKPFALYEPMVPAAGISPPAQIGIESYLAKGRRELRELVHAYLRWLNGPQGRDATPAEMQRRFTFVRLRFNTVLAQFDLFADALTQRSEHETGVWLSGLDVVAADALALPDYYRAPPVICYLDRGVGAAIRRARTRLPGGGENPVAIVRMPRERMIGSGIASSLVHEVGHQAAALLDLVNSLRSVLQQKLRQDRQPEQSVWRFWDRWISEIVSDFWSVARIGIGSTLGLIGVVSLPRPFVFRINLGDPHPFPWIRVKLSCAIGNALYPHPQWARMGQLWESFYPSAGLDEAKRNLLAKLEAGISDFIALLVGHRPPALRGKSLAEVIGMAERQPARLTALWQSWRNSPAILRTAAPSLVFAVIGQARADGSISPEEESQLLANLLTHWALRSTLDTATLCASLPTARLAAPVT